MTGEIQCLTVSILLIEAGIFILNGNNSGDIVVAQVSILLIEAGIFIPHPLRSH